MRTQLPRRHRIKLIRALRDLIADGGGSIRYSTKLLSVFHTVEIHDSIQLWRELRHPACQRVVTTAQTLGYVITIDNNTTTSSMEIRLEHSGVDALQEQAIDTYHQRITHAHGQLVFVTDLQRTLCDMMPQHLTVTQQQGYRAAIGDIAIAAEQSAIKS